MKTNGIKKELFLSGAMAFVALVASMSISTTTLYAGDDDDNGRGYGMGGGYYGGGTYQGDDDDDDNGRGYGMGAQNGNGKNPHGGYIPRGGGANGGGYQTFQNTGFQPIYPLYQKECGSCHFAYQPGLLTQRSWNRVMTTLDKHFGTDATLDENDTQLIGGYLAKFAADSGNAYYKYYQKLNRSVAPDEAPMRISELPYFVKEHRKIPARIIKQPEVKSLAHCQKCHTTAERGIYSERDIMIPGYGRWDD